MKYDESSTEEDPVMLAEGIDGNGKAFTSRIHLNEVDVTQASLTEMTALNVHLAQQGDETVRSHWSLPLATLGNEYDVNTKMDFTQLFERFAQPLANAGYQQEADVYRTELERYLLFGQKTRRVSFQSF